MPLFVCVRNAGRAQMAQGELRHRDEIRSRVALAADDIIEVDRSRAVKNARTLDREFTADLVIVAMGSAYRKLGIDREDELSGRGISWCATCDGFFVRDRTSTPPVVATPPWKSPPS